MKNYGWYIVALLTLLCTRGRAQKKVERNKGGMARVLITLLLLSFSLLLHAQTAPVSQDTTVKEFINIDNADVGYMLNKGKDQFLKGNVELSQDSIFMYADSAKLVNEVQVYAYDNVTIQQGDSLAAFSNELDYNAETLLAKLRGNVVLQRGETELYTQQLDYNLATKVATYHTRGRVVSNTTELSSTHGYYYTDDKKVYFRDSVVVVDDRFEMRADTLMYDLAAERVYFLGPTVIRTDTYRIYCESGYYDIQLDEAVFAQNAQYKSGERLAAADTIKYFGKDEVYILEGDAYVAEGEFQRAEADRINFFRRQERYLLEGNAYLRDSVQTVRGDTVDYDIKTETLAVNGGRPRISAPPMIIDAERFVTDPKTGARTASGSVFWQDTSANIAIAAANATYNEETGYLLATGGAGPKTGEPDFMGDRPLMTTVMNGDTLWMVADTLISVQEEKLDTVYTVRELQRDTIMIGDSLTVNVLTTTDTLVTTDSLRFLSAHRDVRILKSDMQAVCDSLGFNTIDSVLTLYQNPILWQDTSQLTGDTVRIHFKDEALDKVQLLRNALVITTPDLVFFNQVKGKQIEAFFDSTALERTEVQGNAEAIYYILDDAGKYVGVNKTACSAMVLHFRNGGVRKIRFLRAPEGKMEPMQAVNHETYKLEGFRWEIKRKPLTVEDLFRAWDGEAPKERLEIEVVPTALKLLEGERK
jgi:lipopolysaccharide export system protein LptA